MFASDILSSGAHMGDAGLSPACNMSNPIFSHSPVCFCDFVMGICRKRKEFLYFVFKPEV